jgi:DNA polymerase-1
MCEIDYSQLEVVNQGVLTGCKGMIRDLNKGIDFHIKRLSSIMNEAYDTLYYKHHELHDPVIGDARTGAKVYSFQAQYGAGVNTIAYDTGMSKETVKQLFKADEALYPGIKPWYDKLEREIDRTARPCGQFVFVKGQRIEAKRGYCDMPEGTRLVWEQHETPAFLHDKGKYVGFSPTERKNYPAQMLGGHIMQYSLGKVFRWFLANDMFNGEVLMVNTVHDCMWLDGLAHRLPTVAKGAQAIMEAIPQFFKYSYGMDIPVAYPCEAEIGDDMYDMTVLH